MAAYDRSALEQTRFRAENGDGLCYKEHEVFKSDDNRIVGVRCDGVEIDTMDLGAPTARDRSDDIRAFFQLALAAHERKVAADLVVYLLDQLAVADTWTESLS